MARGRITLHPEFGVNPMVTKCYFCQGDKNEIALLGNSYKGEAPRSGIIDMVPCDDCKKLMQDAIICISVRNGEKPTTGAPDPYRTGGWVGLKREAFTRIFGESEVTKLALHHGFAFIEDEVWDRFGFPRGALPGVPGSYQEMEQQREQEQGQGRAGSPAGIEEAPPETV